MNNFSDIYQQGFKDGYQMALSLLNKDKQINELKDTKDIKDIKDTKDIKKSEKIDNYKEKEILLKETTTIIDIINIIKNNINIIERSKIILKMNNVDNYHFLNKNYDKNSLKNMELMIIRIIKRDINKDIYMNISIKNSYITIEKYKNNKKEKVNIKQEKVILIQ